jgi:hypothetical protein
MEWAKALGIQLDVTCCEKSTAETAGGPAELWIYRQGIKALIDGRKHHLKASFCKGLKVALLGRRDFFDAYKVTFDEREESFTLEPYGPREWSETGPTPRPR